MTAIQNTSEYIYAAGWKPKFAALLGRAHV